MSGIDLVMTVLTCGSFSRMVYTKFFPPWFLTRLHAMSVDAELLFFLITYLTRVLILSLGGCKPCLHVRSYPFRLSPYS